LRSIDLRREIQEGLNVIKSWPRSRHSTNRFIFYGNNAELSAFNQAGQEISALSLH
jgi:TnpA family transposase